MANLTVLLNDEDITQFISGNPLIPQMVGDYGQLTINDLPSMTGINTSFFWDPLNQQSPFYQAQDLTQNRIKLVRNSLTIYDGFIQQINIAADRTSEIILRSFLQEALEQGVIYVSDVPETPTDIVERIASLYEIPIDYISFGAANRVYSQNKILFMSFMDLAELSILEAMQNVAEMAMGRVYVQNNLLKYDVYFDRTAQPVFEITDDPAKTATMYGTPLVSPMEKEKVSGWSIEWVGGLAQEGTIRQAKTIQAGPDDPIQIMTLQSAVYLGDLWLQYLNTPQNRVTVAIPAPFGESLSLNNPVRVEQTLTNWSPFVMDLTEIVATDNVQYTVTGIQRAIQS